jgi:hypothetical protein
MQKVLRMAPAARFAYANQFTRKNVRVRTSYLRREEAVQAWRGYAVCVASVESGSVADVLVIKLAGTNNYHALPLSTVLDIEEV